MTNLGQYDLLPATQAAVERMYARDVSVPPPSANAKPCGKRLLELWDQVFVRSEEQMITSPEPGIYENVPFSEYLSWPCLSNSKMRAAMRSLMHFKEQEAIEETASMRLGSLCHTGRLEPSAIYRRYVVMPDLTAGITTKDGKSAKNPKSTEEYERRVNEWRLLHPNVNVVTQDEFDAMVGVVAALDRDSLAREWFSTSGHVELSIVWNDPDTGLRLKARIDKLAPTLGYMVDLKTCRDCTRFQASIADWGYHRQAAMYLAGWEVLTGEILRFGLAAVENVKPFGVMAAPLHEDAIEVGRDEFNTCLRRIADANRTNAWTGYKSPDYWRLPSWYGGGSTGEQVTLTIGGKQVSI